MGSYPGLLSNPIRYHIPYSRWTLATCWQLPATGDCSVRQMIAWQLSCPPNVCLGPPPRSTGRRIGRMEASTDRASRVCVALSCVVNFFLRPSRMCVNSCTDCTEHCFIGGWKWLLGGQGRCPSCVRPSSTGEQGCTLHPSYHARPSLVGLYMALLTNGLTNAL